MALSIPEGKAVYTTRYADFKGVDYQSTDECVDHSRFSDCENLMFDKAGLIEKRLGVRCLDELAGEIHSMKTVNLYGKSELLIHSGGFLYKYDGTSVVPLKKEGYKRYSCLITLPAVAGDAIDRQICIDFTGRVKDFKIKEMFLIKLTPLTGLAGNTIIKPNPTTHYNKSPDDIKDILDGKSYVELSDYYRNILKSDGEDAYYEKMFTPEHYHNQIRNGNFEGDTEGFKNYEAGTHETYANSMRVNVTESGSVYQHINTKSIDGSGYNYNDQEIYYITFLASESFIVSNFSVHQAYTVNGVRKAYYNVTYELEALTKDNTTGTNAQIGDVKSCIATLNNKAWIYTESGTFVYDGIDVIDGEKLAYVPTTTVLRNVNYTCAKANSGEMIQDITDNIPGNSLEPINLLSRKRVNTFALSHFCLNETAYDGSPYSEITLDSEAVSVERIMYLTSNGSYEEMDKMFYLLSGNKITISAWKYVGCVWSSNGVFHFAPKPYVLDGVTENLKVYFTAKEPSEYEKKIDKCHTSTVFGIGKDDRIFVTGNEKYPNYIWYSEFENFGYMPDINYIVTGDGNTEVLGFTKVNEHLLVHKEGNNQDTTIFMVSGSLDSSGKAIFTVTQGINGVGAISERGFTNFDDTPLFLSDKGIYSVESTNIISEKTVVNRSGYINPEFLKHDLKNATMIAYDDMVLCSAGKYIYVLYPRKQSYLGKDTVYNAASFEALRWSIPDTEATIFATFAGGLYLGTKDGRILKWNNDVQDLSKYNDTTAPGNSPVAVKCYFVTKLDDDGSFMTLKTMIKRGCGIMLKPYAQSSVRIFTLTEKEHENQVKDIGFTGAAIMDFDEFWFDIVDFSTRSSGRIIPFNTKIKKYSALSFRVQNDKLSQGFGVIGIEKRYTLGNYKKY